jgi:hypothetical protein
MLINADNITRYARDYRVCTISGRFGGGKTSFAFRLAYELMRVYKFRYIVSNVQSVWNTPINKIELRRTDYGLFVDAIMVLDEGGMFLDRPNEARSWLAYLRKLNVVLLIPTVIAPSLLMRTVTVQRVVNGDALGLPFWFYRVILNSMTVRERDWFLWWQPSEIYGVYDTVGMPSEASDILAYLKKWTDQAASHLKYRKPSAVVGSGMTIITEPLPEPVPTLSLSSSSVSPSSEMIYSVVSDAVAESTSEHALQLENAQFAAEQIYSGRRR